MDRARSRQMLRGFLRVVRALRGPRTKVGFEWPARCRGWSLLKEEMQQLMELEKRMARVEKEKVRLLQQEQRVTSHLTFRSKVLGEELAELEQMQDAEARKRELTLTKLYARLNSRIK